MAAERQLQGRRRARARLDDSVLQYRVRMLLGLGNRLNFGKLNVRVAEKESAEVRLSAVARAATGRTPLLSPCAHAGRRPTTAAPAAAPAEPWGCSPARSPTAQILQTALAHPFGFLNLSQRMVTRLTVPQLAKCS